MSTFLTVFSTKEPHNYLLYFRSHFPDHFTSDFTFTVTLPPAVLGVFRVSFICDYEFSLSFRCREKKHVFEFTVRSLSPGTFEINFCDLSWHFSTLWTYVGFAFFGCFTTDWTFLGLPIVAVQSGRSSPICVYYPSIYGVVRDVNSLDMRNFNHFIISVEWHSSIKRQK